MQTPKSWVETEANLVFYREHIKVRSLFFSIVLSLFGLDKESFETLV